MDHHLTTDALSTVIACSPRRAPGRKTPRTGLHATNTPCQMLILIAVTVAVVLSM